MHGLVVDVLVPMQCGVDVHTHQVASLTTTTTTIQSGEAPFQQARSLHPTLGSLTHAPSHAIPPYFRQVTTSPLSIDYGGNINS